MLYWAIFLIFSSWNISCLGKMKHNGTNPSLKSLLLKRKNFFKNKTLNLNRVDNSTMNVVAHLHRDFAFWQKFKWSFFLLMFFKAQAIPKKQINSDIYNVRMKKSRETKVDFVRNFWLFFLYFLYFLRLIAQRCLTLFCCIYKSRVMCLKRKSVWNKEEKKIGKLKIISFLLSLTHSINKNQINFKNITIKWTIQITVKL